MRRIFKALAGVAAAVAMLLTGGMMTATASADESGMFRAVTAAEQTGSVTVHRVKDGQTYRVYQMLTLETNADYSAFKYKAANGWDDFLTSDAADPYVSVDADGYVTWIKDSNKEEDGIQASDSDKRAFAQAALAYAQKHGKDIADSGHYTVGATEGNSENASYQDSSESMGSVRFNNLPLGYYLVESTTGALVGLTTTQPSADTTDKNDGPTIDKQVQEGNQWGDKNDAAIGDTVNFKTIIHVKKGAKNYRLHDTLSKGLTFNNTVTVYVNGTEVEADEDTWQLLKTPDQGDTFTVSFADSFVANLAGTDIVVTYSATVSKDAVISGAGNPNDTYLEYGNNQKTEHDKTTTFVWEFKVFKYTQKGNDRILLAGATFKLSTGSPATDDNTLKFVKGPTGADGVDQYRLAKAGEEAASEFTTPASGKIHLIGLDSGTYYLTEAKAPSGYDKLENPVKIVIDSKGNVYVNDYSAADEDKTVEIENKPGSELPSAGGMGTTILYATGAVIVIAAALGLAITLRKRRNVR